MIGSPGPLVYCQQPFGESGGRMLAGSSPAALLALVVLGLRGVTAGGRRRTDAGTPGVKVPLGTRPAGLCVAERAGGGRGTLGGHWAARGSGTHRVLGEVVDHRVSEWLLWSLGEVEDPTQLGLEETEQARREVQRPQHVWAAGHLLAKASAAEVLQGGGGVACSDHLHAALGGCGADHGVEGLVLQPGGGHTWGEGERERMW